MALKCLESALDSDEWVESNHPIVKYKKMTYSLNIKKAVSKKITAVNKKYPFSLELLSSQIVLNVKLAFMNCCEKLSISTIPIR